jgi:hypothetical protein
VIPSGCRELFATTGALLIPIIVYESLLSNRFMNRLTRGRVVPTRKPRTNLSARILTGKSVPTL